MTVHLNLTTDEYERRVAGIPGRPIAAVDYYVLMAGVVFDEGAAARAGFEI